MNTPRQFRKKPIVIEAVQFDGENHQDLFDFARDIDVIAGRYLRHAVRCTSPADEGLFVSTPEGEMRISPGDWLIKGVVGEFYPCKPVIFEATYEPM